MMKENRKIKANFRKQKVESEDDRQQKKIIAEDSDDEETANSKEKSDSKGEW